MMGEIGEEAKGKLYVCIHSFVFNCILFFKSERPLKLELKLFSVYGIDSKSCFAQIKLKIKNRNNKPIFR